MDDLDGAAVASAQAPTTPMCATTNGSSISLLLVDDHEIFRQGLKVLLENEPAIRVVGEARDGRTALALARTLQPDVISLKLVIPELNGIDVTRQILLERPDARILALALRCEKALVIGMLEAGGLGYVTRECDLAEYLRAVHDVAAGRMHFSARAAELVMKEYLRAPRGGCQPLSSREREILQLIAEGHTTREITQKLFISSKTVDSHRRNIMAKLGTNSVAGLTKYAIREGLTDAE